MINKFTLAIVLLASCPSCLLAADSSRQVTATAQNSIESVAKAMQVSVTVAAEAKALNIDDKLCFIVMRLTLRCGCKPSDIFAKRKNLSWGEICEEQGLGWREAVEDVEARMAAAGIEAEAATAEQLQRSSSNLPDSVGDNR